MKHNTEYIIYIDICIYAYIPYIQNLPTERLTDRPTLRPADSPTDCPTEQSEQDPLI